MTRGTPVSCTDGHGKVEPRVNVKTGEWRVPGRVHLLGIGGVGMAGLAYLLARQGWRVSGCDARPNALCRWLEEAGIPVAGKHAPEHLDEAERLIVTPAVAPDEPEWVQARARGMPVFFRGEVLAAWVSSRRGVAVCGAHGKTTTACFATRLLGMLGPSPAWCVGGATRAMGKVAWEGAEGQEVFVAEADESDGTLALYRPAVTVVTNMDLDHLDHFANEEALLNCFRAVAAQTREGVAFCRDDPRATLAAQAATVPVLGFGFGEAADLRACAVEAGAESVAFTPVYRGREQARVVLCVTGRHNVLNALGAAAAALILGYDPAAVFAALPQACGELPGRRFECVSDEGGIRVVTDYAHHPVELEAAVAMARLQEPSRLVVVFQPHRYSRTKALAHAFPQALKGADEVILLPVYAASEPWIEGGDSADLYAHFREAGMGDTRVMLARSQEEAWQFLRQTLQPGGLLLLAGAGDVIGMVDGIREDRQRGWPACRDPEGFEKRVRAIEGLHVTPFGTLSEWSFFRTGGWARWRVEAADETALGALLKQCRQDDVPWRFVGAGANSWFSDLGEPGCVIRLAASACREWETAGDEIRVGCNWKGAALLDELERRGLTGLEFLDSVPGSLGGWLAMNAGAHGGEIGERVRWIRCLNSDGEITILHPMDFGFGYRRCGGLTGCIALSCALRVERADAGAVRVRREAFRARRISLAGLRTEGSVFRNPPGDAAGRLLDTAGCKGMRVGGARVTARHANIVAVEDPVTASDVLALVTRMRRRVEQVWGVSLSPEICGLTGGVTEEGIG